MREPETLKATDMAKAKDPCVVFSFITHWTGLVLGVSLRQASRREEFRRALSVAVLGYGVTVRVLMLHALLVRGDRSMLEGVSCSDSHTVPARPLALLEGFKGLSSVK